MINGDEKYLTKYEVSYLNFLLQTEKNHIDDYLK